MEIGSRQIFNLWDTNGRRSDVLNALSIYLNILKEMTEDGTFDQWASFPDSLTQFAFYQKAILNSPEVFRSHPIYDDFVSKFGIDDADKVSKKEFGRLSKKDRDFLRVLDDAIEVRARHYTSNLVRFGFASEKRIISPAGQSYLSGKIEKDHIEKLLPLNDINIILLRQLAKLRIYSKSKNGIRTYYSPFFCALYILMNNDSFNKDDFVCIIQGLGPYRDILRIKELIRKNDYNRIIDEILNVEIDTPIEFLLPGKVTKDLFESRIKNRKSGRAIPAYYSFYCCLIDYLENKNDDTYYALREVYKNNKNMIRKAFCLGKSLFDFGINCTYDRNTFETKNKKNIFLIADNINDTFYRMYEESKYADGIQEYSDTTLRVLNACGLFKFKTLPELSNKSLLEILFSKADIKSLIFGESTEAEYLKYEKNDNFTFGSNTSLVDILEYSEEDVKDIYSKLSAEYGTTDEGTIKNKIETKISDEFSEYIKINYPKERVVELLSLFSNRDNDSLIKRAVNDSATVPTIYEYIVGIAWYYISNGNFDLFHSLNMTLNADFEPEMHAGGGMGDIVINYNDKSVMIEATLMNKAAQKRGEWEPVLRHSLNNKAQNMDKETYTFFVADELDYNTINIWRAVAAAPLRSTSGDETDIDGVIIMPFTNENIIGFVNGSISANKIIERVRESFSKVPKITETNWHNEILSSLK